jgi:site-specific DNA-methyltransferase (adenine-specific)
MFEVPPMSPTPSQLAIGRRRRQAALTLPTGERPIFTNADGVLYRADCLNLFAALDDEVLDCVFADPPFNLGKTYGNGEVRDDLADHEYMKWWEAWLTESIRVLKPGAALFIYNIPRWAYRMAGFLEAEGMTFRHWIALSMKGTFPRGKKLYPAHYALLYFTKGVPKTFNRVRLPVPACRHCGGDIKDYGGHKKYLNPAGLNLTDFWEDTSPARHSKFKARWHVNELKPMIAARCFEISTNPHEIVMDPFGGGGSSYEAAGTLHRYWIGSEITDCQHIVDRLNDRFPAHAGKMPPKDILSIFR